MKNPFIAGFCKVAKIKLTDVENDIGFYLHKGKDRDQAEKSIKEQTASRVGVRHPWLTGIPTLGMWPAISHASALKEIKSDILRGNPELAKRHLNKAIKEQELAHKREMDLMPKRLEEEKTNRHTALAGIGTMALHGALDRYKDRE